jgi:hypothetical protein
MTLYSLYSAFFSSVCCAFSTNVLGARPVHPQSFRPVSQTQGSSLATRYLSLTRSHLVQSAVFADLSGALHLAPSVLVRARKSDGPLPATAAVSAQSARSTCSNIATNAKYLSRSLHQVLIQVVAERRWF